MAHENLHPGTKEHHEYTREDGYQPAELAHNEFPKMLYRGDGETAQRLEVTVNSAEEETKFNDLGYYPLES